MREALALESLELGQLSNLDDLDEQLRDLKPKVNYLPARMTTTLRARRIDDDSPITIHYAKLQESQDMPPGLRRFAAADPAFPRYSTTRQFLTATQFAQLFRLGREAGCQLKAAVVSQDQPVAGTSTDARTLDSQYIANLEQITNRPEPSIKRLGWLGDTKRRSSFDVVMGESV